jgi:hypothetical protein
MRLNDDQVIVCDSMLVTARLCAYQRNGKIMGGFL